MRYFSFFAAISLLLLSGCALSPESTIRPDVPTTDTSTNKVTYKDSDIRDYINSRTAIHTNPDSARMFATAQIMKFEKILYHSTELDRGAIYALFGLGTASGIAAVTGDSISPVKSFALAAAALLGLREVVKPTDQRRIASVSIKGLRCALDLDTQLHTIATDGASILSTDVTAEIAPTTSSVRTFNVAADDEAITYRNNLFATNLTAAAAEGERLRAAVKGASESANRADTLANSVEAITDKALEQFATLNDPTQVYATIQRRLADSGKDVAEARKLTSEYLKKVNDAPPGSSGISSQVSTEIKALLAATERLEKIYSECTDPTRPPG